MGRAGRPSGLDRGLRALQRRGLNQGVLGGSRGWLWVFVAAAGARQVRRAVAREPQVVWTGTVKPGETLQIGHLTETYGGRRVRSRRRKIRS